MKNVPKKKVAWLIKKSRLANQKSVANKFLQEKQKNAQVAVLQGLTEPTHTKLFTRKNYECNKLFLPTLKSNSEMKNNKT